MHVTYVLVSLKTTLVTFFSVLIYPYLKKNYVLNTLSLHVFSTWYYYYINKMVRIASIRRNPVLDTLIPTLRFFKLDTDTPLFFPKIQYLPLLNIPLLIIMRVK